MSSSDDVRPFRADEDEDERTNGPRSRIDSNNSSQRGSQGSKNKGILKGGAQSSDSVQEGDAPADKASADGSTNGSADRTATTPGSSLSSPGGGNSGFLGKFFGAQQRPSTAAASGHGEDESIGELQWALKQELTCAGYLKKEQAKTYGFATRWEMQPLAHE